MNPTILAAWLYPEPQHVPRHRAAPVSLRARVAAAVRGWGR